MFLFSAVLIGKSAEPQPMIERWFRDGRYKVLEQYFIDKLAGYDLASVERASLCNNIAWMYATSNDVKYFKPYKALFYAKKAVAIIQEEARRREVTDLFKETYAVYLDTLAASYFALGDNYSAIYYSEMAVGSCPEGSSHYRELVENLIEFREGLRRNEMPI